MPADHPATGFAKGTLRVYRTAWRQFSAWCERQGLAALPAAPSTLAGWLAELGENGLSLPALIVKASAVRWRHGHPPAGEEETAGWNGPYSSPTDSAEVAEVLERIRRTRSLEAPPTPAEPLAPDLLRRLLRPIDRQSSVRGRRDAALILLTFGGALRRAEVSALRIEDITPGPQGNGFLLHLDPQADHRVLQAAAVPIRYAADPPLCPVRALKAWLGILRAEGLTSGPLFYEVTTADRVWFEDGQPLRSESINRIIQKRIDLAGLAGTFSAHSLRAGSIAAAFERGRPVEQVQAHARHKTRERTLPYLRRRRKAAGTAEGEPPP